jgi:hypothetical protein
VGQGVRVLRRVHLNRILIPVGSIVVSLLLMGATPNPATTGPRLSNGDPSQFMSGFGLQFSAPSDTEVARINKSDAETIAVKQFPEQTGRVRESFLAHVHRDGPSDTDRLCWVVDLTPPGGWHIGSGGPAGSLAPKPTDAAKSFFVVLVDAETGAIWFGMNLG